MTTSSIDRPETIREDEPLSSTSTIMNDSNKAGFAESSVMPLSQTRDDGLPQSTAGDDYFIRSQRSWLVKLGPVKKQMVKGHLIRTLRGLGFGSKRRKITIQVQAPTSNDNGGGKGLHLGRLFGGSNRKKDDDETQDLSHSEADATMERLGEHDVIWIKVYKKPKDIDDDASVATDMGTETSADDGLFGADEAEYSFESNAYELSDIVILERKGKVLQCKIGTGNETVVRDLRFHTAEEADAFARVYAKVDKMASERTQEQLAKFRESNSTRSVVNHMGEEIANAGEDTEKGIAVLCEIVSGQSLPIADLFSTDPYIIVRMGRTEIHRTAYISKSRDPVWTIRTGSLFLLEMPAEQFFSFPSLNFIVKDFDQLGANEILGAVYVPLQDVLTGNGDRREYQIIPRKGFKRTRHEESKPRLYLRFRPASKEDISFMHNFEENKKKVGAYVDETFLRYRPPETSLLKRLHKKSDNKVVLHRVRPFPDPERPDETKWMTKEQIREDSMRGSTNWVEAGSGGRERVGRVFIEVLGCEDLPNMDNLTLDIRDATDAFACLVFEDAIVNTDVIANTLSPRWPSWSQRAFAFNVAHPSSDLMLAVFDYDPEKSPLQMVSRAASSLHDAIGRVQVNLSAFHMNTEYTLCYPLYYGDKAEEMKKSNGKVWIRLRKEWVDVRRALVVGALPPNPPVFVTVARPVDYQVAHYTTEGPHVDTDFNLSIFTEYIQELQSYQSLIELTIQAFMSVWLWRGHFPVTIRGRTLYLPLHSITAYIWAIVLTRNFNTLPSFFFFSIGWFFLATNEQVNRSPSVWNRTPHFTDGIRLLLNFKWADPAVNISPNYNADALEAYAKANTDRVAQRKHEMELELKYEGETKQRYGSTQGEAEFDDTDITTSHGGTLVSKVKDLVNPITLAIRPVLHPIQLQLRSVIIALRIVKSIVMWEEYYYAFWITLASFALAVVLIWVPWAWILRWILRVVAWVGLGPWMMLVDKKYFAENPDLTQEEREELIRKKVEARYEAVMKAASDYQVRKERFIKLKSMSTYMFGKFHLRVPRFNEDLVTITPLPESYAKVYDPSKAKPIRLVDRKYGQRLEGDMIPMRDIQIAAKKKTNGHGERRTLLHGKAGRALGRVQNGVAPIGKGIMGSISEGEHMITDHIPLLRHKNRNSKEGDTDASDGGSKAEPSGSKPNETQTKVHKVD